MNKLFKKILDILPGLLLSVLIVVISTYITKFIPKFGTATYAILIGILLGNTIFQQNIWKKGTAFSEKRLLELSVFFLGYSISADSFKQIGIHGFLIIVFMLVSTIAFVMWLGKKNGVSSAFGKLFASGNAICGSSAIAAVSDVVECKEEERSNSIVLINLGGTILMLLLPFIAGIVFGGDVEKSGLLIGSIVQSVGQVAGAGSQMGPEVLEIAMVTKIIRVLLLVFVVIYFSSTGNKNKETTSKTKKNVLSYVPWYIIGFAALFAIRSIFGSTPEVVANVKLVGGWFELTALAAIGLRLDIRSLAREGKTYLIYVFETLAFQVIVAIAVISIVFSII